MIQIKIDLKIFFYFELLNIEIIFSENQATLCICSESSQLRSRHVGLVSGYLIESFYLLRCTSGLSKKFINRNYTISVGINSIKTWIGVKIVVLLPFLITACSFS